MVKCLNSNKLNLSTKFLEMFIFIFKNPQKVDGKSITGSSIIKIILGILFEGFLKSILSVSGLKSEGRCTFFNNKVSVILDKFSSYLCVLLLFTTYTGNI